MVPAEQAHTTRDTAAVKKTDTLFSHFFARQK